MQAVLAAASADYFGNANPFNQLNGNQCAAHGQFDGLTPPNSDGNKLGLGRAIFEEAEPERQRSLFERIAPPPDPARKTENKVSSVFDDIPLARPNGDAHSPFLNTIPAYCSANNLFGPTAPSAATPTSSCVPAPKIAAPAASARCPTSISNSGHTNTANNNTDAEVLKSAPDTMAGSQPPPSIATKTAEVYSHNSPFAGGGYINSNLFAAGAYRNYSPFVAGAYSNGNPFTAGAYSNGNPFTEGGYSKDNPFTAREYSNRNPTSGPSSSNLACGSSSSSSTDDCKPRSLFERISLPSADLKRPGKGEGEAEFNAVAAGATTTAADKPKSLFDRISFPASSATAANPFNPATDSCAACSAVPGDGTAWPNPFQPGIDSSVTTARDGLPDAGEPKPADRPAQQKPRSLFDRTPFPPELGKGAGRAVDSAGTGTGPAPRRKTVRFEGVVGEEEDGEADSPPPSGGFSASGAVPRARPVSQVKAGWNPAPPRLSEEGTAATQEPKAQAPPRSEAQTYPSPQAYAPPNPQVLALPRPEAQKPLKRKAQVAQAPLKPKAQGFIKPRAQMPPNLKAQALPKSRKCAARSSLKTKAQIPPPKPLDPRPEAQIPREPQALIPWEPQALTPLKPEVQIPQSYQAMQWLTVNGTDNSPTNGFPTGYRGTQRVAEPRLLVRGGMRGHARCAPAGRVARGVR